MCPKYDRDLLHGNSANILMLLADSCQNHLSHKYPSTSKFAMKTLQLWLSLVAQLKTEQVAHILAPIIKQYNFVLVNGPRLLQLER